MTKEDQRRYNHSTVIEINHKATVKSKAYLTRLLVKSCIALLVKGCSQSAVTPINTKTSNDLSKSS